MKFELVETGLRGDAAGRNGEARRGLAAATEEHAEEPGPPTAARAIAIAFNFAELLGGEDGFDLLGAFFAVGGGGHQLLAGFVEGDELLGAGGPARAGAEHLGAQVG